MKHSMLGQQMKRISAWKHNERGTKEVFSVKTKAAFTRQTEVGKLKLVCVNGIKTVSKHVSIWRKQFANLFSACFCAVHTHQFIWVFQHEFANLSLPCEGRLKAPGKLLIFWKLFISNNLSPFSGRFTYNMQKIFNISLAESPEDTLFED